MTSNTNPGRLTVMRTARRLHLLLVPTFLTALLSGCGNGGDKPDAYGNFEAVETTVSARSDGDLKTYTVNEGDHLEAGQVVGQIDTVQLALSRAALEAQRNAQAAQVTSVGAEVDVLQEQLRIAEIDKDRVHRLFANQAATQKQVDDADGRASVLERQITSTKTRAASLRSQINAIEAQLAQVVDKIDKSTITNPISGVVLTNYVEPHELVRTGTPLYRIANLSSLDMRAYLGETQLSDIAIGDVVTVTVDAAEGGFRTVDGTVSWISSTAEFTPRTVQTRDERTNLVYAFKVRVPNPDGRLKIGMPADVRFKSHPSM